MFARLLLYVFPLFLLFLEWILRNALNVGTREFLGPTLAAVGLGLILPVTIPKEAAAALPAKLRRELAHRKAVIRFAADNRLIEIAWLLLIVATGGWTEALYIACTRPDQTFWVLPLHAWLGIVVYFLGIFLTEIKEAV